MNHNLKHLFFTQTILFVSLFLFFSSTFVHAQEGTFEALKRSGTTTRSIASPEAVSSSSSTGAGIHIVKKSETLYGISRKYGMSVAEIKRMNSIRGDVIKPGERLKVMITGNRGVNSQESMDALQRGVANGASSSINNLAPRDQVDMELDILTSTRATYPPPINGNATARTRAVKPLVPTSTLAKSGKISVEKRKYYQVKRGDDIYSIADTYQVSVDELRGWNMLQNVKPDQTIIVKKWYEEIDEEEANKLDEEINTRSTTTSTRAIETASEAAQLRLARAQKREQEMTDYQRQNMVDSRSINVSPAFGKADWIEGTQADFGPYDVYSNKDISDLRFYAIHPTLPVGSKIKMELPGNPGYIELIIVGHYNNYNTNAIVGLSPAAVKILKDAGESTVTIRY